jgi:hypothetical protein
MLKQIALSCALAITTQAGLAQENRQLAGIWKLVSFDTEFQATGERRAMFGKQPKGYIIFTPQGRMMALLTAEARKPAENDQDRAALFRTMFGYSGIYRVEDDKVVTEVDVSWNEQWNGTRQVRFFKLDGDRLDIISAWAPSALPDRPVIRGILTWERVKESR